MDFYDSRVLEIYLVSEKEMISVRRQEWKRWGFVYWLNFIQINKVLHIQFLTDVPRGTLCKAGKLPGFDLLRNLWQSFQYSSKGIETLPIAKAKFCQWTLVLDRCTSLPIFAYATLASCRPLSMHIHIAMREEFHLSSMRQVELDHTLLDSRHGHILQVQRLYPWATTARVEIEVVSNSETT